MAGRKAFGAGSGAAPTARPGPGRAQRGQRAQTGPGAGRVQTGRRRPSADQPPPSTAAPARRRDRALPGTTDAAIEPARPVAGHAAATAARGAPGGVLEATDLAALHPDDAAADGRATPRRSA